MLDLVDGWVRDGLFVSATVEVDNEVREVRRNSAGGLDITVRPVGRSAPDPVTGRTFPLNRDGSTDWPTFARELLAEPITAATAAWYGEVEGRDFDGR